MIRSRGHTRPALAVALALAFAVGLLLVPSSAQAGVRDRKDDLRTQVAVIADLLGDGHAPAKLTKRTLKRRYDYRLEKPIRIASYKRLKNGREYRVCVRHPRGGTAAFNSVKGSLTAFGRGRACHF